VEARSPRSLTRYQEAETILSKVDMTNFDQLRTLYFLLLNEANALSEQMRIDPVEFNAICDGERQKTLQDHRDRIPEASIKGTDSCPSGGR